MSLRINANALIALSLLLIFCGLTGADETDLIWSTYLAGDDSEGSHGIALDKAGNVYLTGTSASTDFPITAGAFDTTHNIGWDVFVTKLNELGSSLNYSTFLGGSGTDKGYCIALDDSGNAYLAGETSSTNFPVTAGAFDTTNNGFYDVFVVKLNQTGSALSYATFLGGAEYDRGYSLALDGSGHAYVTGYTMSSDFPTTGGAFDTTYNGGYYEAIVFKLNPTGATLDYATFLGGTDRDYGFDIVLDSFGYAFVSGWTKSTDFPTTDGAFDTTHNGDEDAFVVKLNPSGNALNYATFLGGSDHDRGYGLALDCSGHAYVTGETWSIDFPTTAGAFDTTHDGISNVLVVKLNTLGSALEYATLLGALDDSGYEIAVDGSDHVYVTGYTMSPDFPTTVGAYDTTHNGNKDLFVVKLNARGSTLDYSTFLGGSRFDRGMDLCVVDSGITYVTGYTLSDNFPTTPGAFDETAHFEHDVVVAKLDLSGYPVPVVLSNFQATGGPSFIALLWVTASEVNCHRWEVYRGDQEGGEYIKIGELSGHGSTETAHTYRWVDRQVTAGMTFFYKLRQVDFDGSASWSQVVYATAYSSVPRTYALHQNYPNPFNTNTEISYEIPEDGHVTLKVFNILGQEVRALVDAEQKAGEYDVLWDGRDASGHEVASGLYFCRLKVGEFQRIIKMVLIK